MAFNWAGAAGGVQDALSQALREQLLVQESHQRQQSLDDQVEWRKMQAEVNRQNAASLEAQRNSTIEAANREKAAVERRMKWAESVLQNPEGYDELDIARAKNVVRFGEDLPPSVLAQHIKGPKELTGSSANEQDAMEAMAKRLGIKVSDLTPEQRMEARGTGRKAYGQADDRDPVFRPPVPIVIQTGTGYGMVDRTTGQVRPVTGAGGEQEPLPPTSAQRDKLAGREQANVIIQSVDELSKKINTGKGLMATLTGAAERAKAQANYNDDVAEYESVVAAFIPMLARANGHTGVLTQQDVDSTRKMLPYPEDSKTLRDRKMARIAKIMGGLTSGPNPQAGANKGGGATADPLEGKTGVAKDGTPVVRRNGKWVAR